MGYMKNNGRRDSRGDILTNVSQPRLAWMLTFIAALPGCQTITPVTQNLENSGIAPLETSQANVEPTELSTIEVLQEPETDIQEIEPSPTITYTEQELLSRIRSGSRLPQDQDPSIDAELNWFATHPDYLERVLSRSESYLYHIVEALEHREMPLDLGLLPVVESAFDPFAYSHGRAAGLWQIIPGTGQRLGLKQNWWYDGRRDVLESTRAALDYLQYLNDLFDGDWLLTVAGYNSGEGNVARAIRQAEAAGEPTDFWHIRRYLPLETRTYVPRLLALQRVVIAPHDYDLSLPVIQNEPRFEVVDIDGQIDMALAAELIGISTDELYRLNPGVNRWATDPDGPHRLLVPVERATNFDSAMSDLSAQDRVRWSRHQVKAGETLGHLALTYQTTSAVLKKVNNLGNDMIRIGQNLMIPHAVKNLESYTQTLDARRARTLNQTRDGQRHSHTVQSGDSLWSISRQYNVTTMELARWNAMAPGDTLRVGRELFIWIQPAVSLAPTQNERIRRLTYTVRKGDSLSRISTRFRVTVPELLEWNNLSANKYLQPGQRLIMYVDVTEQTT